MGLKISGQEIRDVRNLVRGSIALVFNGQEKILIIKTQGGFTDLTTGNHYGEPLSAGSAGMNVVRVLGSGETLAVV